MRRALPDALLALPHRRDVPFARLTTLGVGGICRWLFELLAAFPDARITIEHSIANGDARRTQYQTQLEGAGPVELETAAITAIATGDMPLAAAVATVVDRRPSDRRPFSVAAFAERMWGAQHAEVTAKLKGVLLAERTARAANDEFVRGKADPIANLSNQLAARAIAEASGEEDEA